LKPDLVRALGATYHSEGMPASRLAPDVIVECTGVPQVVVEALTLGAADRITCLTGVSGMGQSLALDIGSLNRDAVLRNDVVFGSVNANRRHYEQAAAALLRADVAWLARLISRRVPLDEFADAFDRRPDDVKVVLDLQDVSAP
jgi:threonine dehydrogenase-like Zn-dependent dehydrogenase